MAYSWDNRVKFVIRHMYDIDNNGFLDAFDFECLALRYTVFHGKGKYNAELHEQNKKLMGELWTEMSALSDFNRDGQVTAEEFKKGVQNVCTGKTFDSFPSSMKHAINCKFTSTDNDGDGKISLEEYRIDVLLRCAFSDIKEIDDAFEKLLNDADRKAGGISQTRYQELYAHFIGNPEPDVQGATLFGPLTVLD